MTAQRRCRRFMGLALTSGPLLVAGVVWASPAQADAASYLNDMHNVGIQDFDGGDAAMLHAGQVFCGEIWDGYPPAELAAMALQTLRHRPGRSWAHPQTGRSIRLLCQSRSVSKRLVGVVAEESIGRHRI